MFESVKQWHYECFLLAFAGISNITELETSHEEADTKIILHEMHLREAHNVNVTISSPSGDTNTHILIVDGYGEGKKLNLSGIDFKLVLWLGSMPSLAMITWSRFQKK